MKEKCINALTLILKILLSISIIAAGLSLIYGCLLIYYSGDAGYSANEVKEVFIKIQLPLYICLGLLVLSIISQLFFPASDEKLKNNISVQTKLMLLSSKKDFEKADEKVINAYKKEEKKKKAVNIFSAFAVGVLSFIFLSYAVNPENYDSQLINESVISAIKVLLPCLLGMFSVLLFAKLLNDKLSKNQIELIKKLPSKAKADVPFCKDTKGLNLIIRYSVLILAVVLIILGLASGGVYDVITKAVNICTECIGLG